MSIEINCLPVLNGVPKHASVWVRNAGNNYMENKKEGKWLKLLEK
jgi:hypothetical protein